METITIATSRGPTFAETEMLVLSAVIVGAVIVWTVVSGLKTSS